MPPTLVLLIAVGVAGMAMAAFAFLEELRRKALIERSGGAAASPAVRAKLIRDGYRNQSSGWRRLLKRAPSVWAQSDTIRRQLMQAGNDSPTAPLTYSLLRVVCLIGFPALALPLILDATYLTRVVAILGAALLGLIAPPWYVLRAIRLRQEKLRRSLPDSLDLLVVCVEAGISLDAAILRVARDLAHVHPELASEFIVVNRKTNAGVSREEALRGLWERTGVDELRTLASSLIQSEKWGTSSARVLRVASEGLRRRRRQLAERRAATAPVKMVIPLALLIFPALFVVILGPAAMSIVKAFSAGGPGAGQ